MAKRNLKAWQNRVLKVLQGRKKPRPIKVKMGVTSLAGPRIFLLLDTIEDFSAQVLSDFIEEHIVPEIRRGYDRATHATHAKKFIIERSGGVLRKGTIRTADWSGHLDGLRVLEERLTKHVSTRSVGHIGEQVGYKLSQLKSNQMSTHNTFTRSQLTNWFFTVEFGTGIAANVGGERWVRKPGHSPVLLGKDGKSLKEKDGSWWYGPRKGMGMHMLGQKGANVFWEYGSRRPKTLWKQIFEERLPGYFGARFRQYTGATR